MEIGDWIYCEFELKQITRKEDGKIKAVSDGFITISSNDLSDLCFSINFRIKMISDNFLYWHKKFLMREIIFLIIPAFITDLSENGFWLV